MPTDADWLLSLRFCFFRRCSWLPACRWHQFPCQRPLHCAQIVLRTHAEPLYRFMIYIILSCSFWMAKSKCSQRLFFSHSATFCKRGKVQYFCMLSVGNKYWQWKQVWIRDMIKLYRQHLRRFSMAIQGLLSFFRWLHCCVQKSGVVCSKTAEQQNMDLILQLLT